MAIRPTNSLVWNRRQLLQAAAGATVCSLVGHLAASETQVAAEHACIDMPIMSLEITDETQAALISPVDAALLDAQGRLSFEDTAASPDAQAALSMAPTDEYGDEPEAGAKAAFLNRWPIDRLKVYFFPNVSQRLVSTILDKAKEWSDHAKLEFVHSTRLQDSQIRVNCIRGRGHWSAVGPDAEGQRGQQTMNLDVNELNVSSAYNLGVILHEFGHAMGMIHEHSSASSPIRFKPANSREMLDYFVPRGLKTAQVIQRNVIQRYSASQLIRFSQFDADSIMLYAFPDHLTLDGRGTRQNTVLSATDKKFAGLLYPKPYSPPEEIKPPVAAGSLAFGGGATTAVVKPGVPVELRLEIPADHDRRPAVIFTQGTTQVMISIRSASGQDLTPKGLPQHGTPDLVNDVIQMPMAAGEYQVRFAHPSTSGSGPFQATARSGTYDRPLISPNRAR